MEVTGKRILFVVLCLLVGSALLYVGSMGQRDLRWTMAGGYFVIVGIGAGLTLMGRMLPGRAGAILTSRLAAKVAFWAMIAMMLLLVFASFGDQGR